jgi:hypothetical protein
VHESEIQERTTAILMKMGESWMSFGDIGRTIAAQNWESAKKASWFSLSRPLAHLLTPDTPFFGPSYYWPTTCILARVLDRMEKAWIYESQPSSTGTQVDGNIHEAADCRSRDYRMRHR